MTDKELRSGEDSIVQKPEGKAVRERQTRFRRISAITSDIAYSCHTRKDGRFSLDWMTGAAERITGYSIEEIKAHGCWRFLVVEEDIPLFEKHVIGLAPGSRGSCELRIRHKNGSIVWISSFAECVAEAKIPGRLLYGGLTEITERKQAEEKLSASETRYRRLFEAAKDGILILDADTGMIVDANSSLTEMLGFSRDEFLGKHIWDLGFFKDIVANEADFLKLQQNEYIRYEDVLLETADGRHINVEFVSNLYPVGPGKVIQCSVRGAHLASFPAQNPYPVVEVGIDGAVRFANPAAMATLARLGLDPDARQFLPGTPEDLGLLRSHCERNPQTQELRLGKASFLRVVAAPPGGNSLHVYLVDITERKRSEEALRDSENKYRLLVENSHDIIYMLDLQGIFTFVSPSWKRILGHDVTSVVGHRVQEFVHPDDIRRCEDFMASALQTSGPLPGIEYRVRNVEGEWKWHNSRGAPVINADGTCTSFVVIASDVTERKWAEEVLRQSEVKYRLLIDTASESIVVAQDGLLKFVNPAALDLFGGYSEQEVINRPFPEFIHPDDRSMVVENYRRRIAGEAEQPPRYGFRVVTRDGIVRWVEINAALIEWDGKPATLNLLTDITERKQAEEELRESKKLLSQTEKTAHIGGWVFDAEKLTQEWTEETFRILEIDVTGGEPKVPEGLDFIAPAFRPMAEQGIRRAIEVGEPYNQEWEVITAKGNRRWVHAVGEAYQEQGKTKRVWGTFQDITERKRAEEELRESEERYRTLIQNVGEGIGFVSPEEQFSFANAAAEDIFGVPPGSLLERSLREFTSPEQFGMIREQTDRRQAGEKGVYEIEINRPTGEKRNLLITAVPQSDSQGKFLGAVGVFRDITDRKQTEEKLRMSEADLQQAQATAHVGSWRWDIAHDEFAWSDEMCRIFGIAPHAVTGSVQDVLMRTIHPDDRASIEESNRAIIEDHNPQPLEYRIIRPDGSVRTVWAEPGEMTLDDNGNVSSLTGVVLDITERKQAEAQLRQSQKMGAIGELAGGVAHDFNNLLTGILGNIALMRSSLPPADPLLENLNAAETSARQAADLTKGLLTFSRSAVVLPVPMNITAALDATLVLLKQSLPATMEIVRDYEQTAWNVLLDQSQMTQILLNLAVNARDAMKGKGTLTIRARNVTVDAAYVHEHPYARTGEFVRLSVSDTGSGMSAEVMQHLFEPFYTTKPVGSGTGLGLSIVYGAVKQAGGWITAVSTESVGATFDIYLPRCLEEPTESFAPSPPSLNVRGGTVLVVEDEPVVRAVAQALLTRSGYMVLTAPDRASALNVLQDHPLGIGLILLDMTMPGMTSGEVVQAIRALDPTVPILLNSGYTSNGTVKQMLEENSVQGFLGKPYDLDQLLNTVDRLMKQS